LYKLRARIQQNLARAPSVEEIFPLCVGLKARASPENPSDVAELSLRWNDLPSGVVDAATVAAATRRHYRNYSSADELLWDAQRWYRRSWECFRASGDRVRVAKVAIELSKLQLQCVFVPVRLRSPIV
jgi:hypothetical protein